MMQGHFAALYSKCVIFCMLSLTNVPNMSFSREAESENGSLVVQGM